MLGTINVVDASALAAITFNEPEAENIASLLGETKLVAPTLLFYEMASICQKKLRKYPQQKFLILAAYANLPKLDIETIEVEFQALVGVAEETGLTTYDAAYLWLANALDASLVTLDKRLASAHHDSLPKT